MDPETRPMAPDSLAIVSWLDEKAQNCHFSLFFLLSDQAETPYIHINIYVDEACQLYQPFPEVSRTLQEPANR
jgi:hypothetical protein